MKTVKGYKAFESDWTCRGKKYTCPGVFEDCAPEDLKICSKGIHFCERLIDCFEFYNFSEQTKIAEVESLGKTLTDGVKTCTDKIRIIREVPWDEVLRLVNTGKGNSGNRNSGNRNSGNWNSGNWNSGDCNSGDWNSGNWNSGNRNSGNRNSGNRNSGNRNSGDCNSGNCNSGNCNSGDCNSGSCNSGDWNSGDWNSGNWNSGCFNVGTPKISMFGKQSEWTLKSWRCSEAYVVMECAPYGNVWIPYSNMTDEEKKAHPEAEVQQGYLRRIGPKELEAKRNEWWRGLTDKERQAVLDLPNFDEEIFYKCTLIRVGKEKE